MCLDRVLDDRQQVLFIKTRDMCPEVEGHLLTDYGSHRQRLAHLFAQARQSALDHLTEIRREDKAVDFVQLPLVSDVAQESLFLERPQELPGKEGVAFRMALEIVDETILLVRRQSPAAAENGPQFIDLHSAQVEAKSLGVTNQRRQLSVERITLRRLVDAIGHQQQKRQGLHVDCKIAKQFQAAGIRPVKVFQHDQG